MIRQRLSGKRIAITGSTGFLGTALVERLLRSVPDCVLVLVVRTGRRTASDRVAREVLRNDAFERLRREVGGAAAFDEMTSRRVVSVSGDVAVDGLGLDEEGRRAIASCDIFIHSAATFPLAS